MRQSLSATSLAAMLALCVPAMGQTAAAPPAPRTPAVAVELNKLEPVAGACRAYFVVGNKTQDQIRELKLDVFLFDKPGVIMRRVAMTFPDIRPDRSKVVLFDFADLTCGDIGRFMVNDVMSCTSQAGTPLPSCAAGLATSSRTAAELAN